MGLSDLSVREHSDSLKGFKLDLVISGSIGAVESPRLIRALRRLGAEVVPVLTPSAQMFVTPMAVSWAAACDAVTEFSATASHIALHDACIVAPCSAHLIGEIAGGLLSSPASALIASYLGQKRPVILVPNMHDSLIEAPAVQANLAKIAPWLMILKGRQDEGKQKFPEPQVLADQCSHLLRQAKLGKSLVLTMGTTRGYIDDVRYISNYSSGALGTELAHEAYRQGFKTTVIAGPCPIRPSRCSQLVAVETNEELESQTVKALEDADIGLFAASVLDFVPARRIRGKTSSQGTLEVDFVKTKKLLGAFKPRGGFKVAFKLEVDLSAEKARGLAQEYMLKYDLNLVIVNALHEVSETTHKASIFARTKDGLRSELVQDVCGKAALAQAIIKLIR